MTAESKVILASGSPRRRQLLSEAGIEFEVVESGVAEVRNACEEARDYALRMAREKARAVSARLRDAIAIGADTIVVCGDEVLEKPLSSDDAHRMLRMLSGRTHLVVTAFAIARKSVIVESEAVESRVTFRTLTDGEIGEYVATGEPLDKAGAYGIQGLGGGFIASVDGPRDNVMGLPTARVVAALARAGVAPRHPR
ncbi:MAG TPA: nucleoside triphosphate pyrophosphatase [Candidatus Acidoferrales bacterium]|nr:nucleoside triphosphate pyrophosphatase [Candidatus Acidoferrales bacterium]